MSTGEQLEENSTASSSAIESTLPDNCGTSSAEDLRAGRRMSCGREVAEGAGEEGALVGSLGTSSMSSLQMRFSSLLPWGRESAHLDITVCCVSNVGRGVGRGLGGWTGDVLLQRL